MRVLWLCNSKLAIISRAQGNVAAVNGGWMDGAAESLLSSDEVSQLAICYPQDSTTSIVEMQEDAWKAYGFPYGKGLGRTPQHVVDNFKKIIEDNHPDVIHIHGTEFPYCESMMLAAEDLGLLSSTRISIQGLVSVCAGALLDGVPARVAQRRTLSEMKNGSGLLKQVEDYKLRGQAERRAIAAAGAVIGRTEWDRACCEQINPSVPYYFCGETLRSEFYEAEPGYDASAKTIFFSQGDKPIKGLHNLIKALPIIKDMIPDIKVKVSGSFGFRSNMFRGTSYGIWCHDLAAELGVLDCFCFLGTLDAPRLIEEMKACSCFASTSSMENSSNSLGEAMMLGLPCVSSFVGGMPSMAVPEKEVLFYPYSEPNMLADAILRLFKNRELAARLSVAGRERALHNHSPQKNLEDLILIYRNASTAR